MQSFIIFCAQYLFMVPIAMVVLAFILLEPDLRRTLFLRLFGAALFCSVFSILGGTVYHETRPFITHHLTPLIQHANDNCFPSNHTLVAACCSFVLIPYRLLLAVFGILATIFVAWSRVATMLHSPFDVIVSILVAGFACLMLQVLVRKRQKETPVTQPVFEQRQKAA